MSTIFFVLFLGLAGVGLFLPTVLKGLGIESNVRFAGFVMCPLFLLLCFAQTAMYVGGDSRGIVSTKFGSGLTNSHVVAFNGERGPQAWTLAPGWNFGLWPWQYNLEENPNMPIPVGKVGIVTAKDGKPLVNQAYADEWDSVEDMMDGMKFGETGFAGPQVTVIPSGKTIPYNPYLFEITLADALIIKQDECVVIKSNHGSHDAENNNDGSLVDKGSIGVWKIAYGPGTHYINTNAYEDIHCKTTKRVYSYTSKSSLGKSDRSEFDHSIGVKTMDGYEFPVEIRVEVITPINDCPYIVSKIGPPDADINNDGFDNLEVKVILPALRSIIRNTAEHTNALDYLNSRSKVESDATNELREAITDEFKVTVIAVRIADIGLKDTPEGAELMKTQTDQELAKQQIAAYAEQKIAAEAEKDKIEAETAASEQTKVTASEKAIDVGENEGKAAAKKAAGEAEAVELKIAAYGGYSQFIMSEAIKAFGDNWNGEFPEVVVVGEGAGLDTAVLAKIMQSQKKVVDSEEKVE